MDQYFVSFMGGCLIGLSVALMLMINGRITGNSGIAAGLLSVWKDKAYWKLFYLLGLVLGVITYGFLYGVPEYELNVPYAVVVTAGLLVGYGTRMGGGCTSGHGVCGMARFSKRSIVATMVFMLSAIVTVFMLRQSGVNVW